MRSRPGRGAWMLLGVLVAAFLAVGPLARGDVTASEAVSLHIVLDRSAPAGDSTVAGPVQEIRLFFSDAPLMRGASVRVTDAGRSLLRTSPPTQDESDGKQVFVQLDPPLPPGAYVVQWRCIADDGHVMRGDFTFEVAAE